MAKLYQNIELEISELERHTLSEPTPEIFAKLVDMHRNNGDLSRASYFSEKALLYYPQNTQNLLAHVRLLMDMDELADAETYLHKIVETATEDVAILLLWAQLYAKKGDLSGLNAVGRRLGNRFPNDVRAKKFLQFLQSKGIVKPSAPAPPTETPAPAKPAPKPQPEPAPAAVPVETPTPPAPQIPPVPIESLMALTGLLKRIAGVGHVVLLTGENRALASPGCPQEVAKMLGTILVTYKRTLSAAFAKIAFGTWTRAVLEYENANVHVFSARGCYFALQCGTAVSLGALRFSVSAVIEKHFAE